MDQTSLYHLPKDVLVQLIAFVQHNDNNNYRMLNSLVGHRVAHYECYKKGCTETCMSYDGRPKRYLKRDENDERLDHKVEFAFPHLKEKYKLSDFRDPDKKDLMWNTTGALCDISCGIWACGKHWKEVFYENGNDFFECPDSVGG